MGNGKMEDEMRGEEKEKEDVDSGAKSSAVSGDMNI
jgi:hypothetical protein